MAITIDGWIINNTGLITKTIGPEQAIISLNANGKFDVERISKNIGLTSTFDNFVLINLNLFLAQSNYAIKL